jgi:hypothetical protein
MNKVSRGEISNLKFYNVNAYTWELLQAKTWRKKKEESSNCMVFWETKEADWN